jgi:hypothetical protein
MVSGVPGMIPGLLRMIPRPPGGGVGLPEWFWVVREWVRELPEDRRELPEWVRELVE